MCIRDSDSYLRFPNLGVLSGEVGFREAMRRWYMDWGRFWVREDDKFENDLIEALGDLA